MNSCRALIPSLESLDFANSVPPLLAIRDAGPRRRLFFA